MSEKKYNKVYNARCGLWEFVRADGSYVVGLHVDCPSRANDIEDALAAEVSAALSTSAAEIKAANDNAEFIVAHLHQVVRLLREEVKYSRVHLIREEHPDGGTVAPFYSLNTHGTQADDCNYADARAAVDDAKALADPVIP